MNRKLTLAVRLDPETERRLTEASKRLKLSKHQLMIMAIEAALDAIDGQNGKLVIPIEFQVSIPLEFQVTNVPAKNHTGTDDTSSV